VAIPDESHHARNARPRDWRIITRRVVAVVAVLVMLWLLQHCREEPSFDYFAAKAEELGRDATRITAYVRGLEELSYRGDLKGALGTLFGEAGSPEEKLALLEALLAHTRAPVPATLAAVAPDARGPAPERPFEVVVAHLSYLPDGTARETPVFKGPVGALVGDVHSISVPRAERTRLEPVRRGIYAGAVGYLDFAGNLDFCIAIRSVVVERGIARVQAGAGIVADSNPAAEYDETRDKARAMMQALDLAQRGL